MAIRRKWNSSTNSYHYLVDFMYQGRRIRQSAGPDKVLAKQVEFKMRSLAAEGKLLDKKRTPRVLFKDFGRKYLETYSKNKRTYLHEVARMKHMADFFGNCVMADMKPQDVEAYKVHLANGVSPSTVNRYLVQLKHMFNKAIEAGAAGANPVCKVKFFKVANQRVRYLSDEEADLLLNSGKEELQKRCNGLLEPLVKFALSVGLRIGEILSLRWVDVDLKGSTVFVNSHKTMDTRRIPVSGKVCELLDALPRRGTYIFMGLDGKPYGRDHVTREFQAVLRGLAISDFHFHDLRHTWASWMAMSGIDLLTIQQLGGWKSLKMVMRYAHLSHRHKREAVNILAAKIAKFDDKFVTYLSPGDNGGFEGFKKSVEIALKSTSLV